MDFIAQIMTVRPLWIKCNHLFTDLNQDSKPGIFLGAWLTLFPLKAPPPKSIVCSDWLDVTGLSRHRPPLFLQQLCQCFCFCRGVDCILKARCFRSITFYSMTSLKIDLIDVYFISVISSWMKLCPWQAVRKKLILQRGSKLWMNKEMQQCDWANEGLVEVCVC